MLLMFTCILEISIYVVFSIYCDVKHTKHFSFLNSEMTVTSVPLVSFE